MMVLSRRGAFFLSLLLLGLIHALPVAAQHNDTVVVGPEETAHLIDSLSGQARKDALAAAAEKDTTPSSLDSESLERAAAKPEPVVLRSVPGSVTGAWKKEKAFAYANDPSYWKKEAPVAPQENGFLRFLQRVLSSEAFKYFIYFLLASVLLYAIIRIIAENNLRFFYRSPGKAVAGPAEVSDPLEEDLEGQLQEALRSKDNRLAIRWLYLKSLRQLKERGLIRYHVDATNREYVRQLAGAPLGEMFASLTGVYERVWYGKIPLSEGSFDRLYQYFQEFYKSIGHP